MDTGLRLQIVSKLSQAAAHTRRGTNVTRNGIFPARNDRHATTTRAEKAKGKLLYFAIFTARDDAFGLGLWTLVFGL
jgi:hypothetical protein